MRNQTEKEAELFIKKHGMIREGDVVIAGVSGGADSICLLFVLHALRGKMNFDLRVCHVNHCLRGKEADEDEAYVTGICHKLGISCRVFRKDVELISRMRKQSTEEAGRAVRRQAFEEMCEGERNARIATAHHRGDNVETVLLNLARGTGLKGLCGIQPVCGKWIRPLLGLDRDQIESYLLSEGIAWREDATNNEDIYTRNRIRHLVIPLLTQQINSGAVRHIDELSGQLREVWEYLDDGVEKAWKQCVRTGGDDVCQRWLYLDGAGVDTLAAAVKKQLIRRSIAYVRGEEKDIESVHVSDVLELFRKKPGKQLDLPGASAKRCREGVRICRVSAESCRLPVTAPDDGKGAYGEKEELLICLNVPGETFVKQRNWKISCRFVECSDMEYAGNIPQKSYTKWLDYDIIKYGLSIRTRKSGDYLAVTGDGRKQKLKSYFINEKVPREERDRIPLIADGSHIVWIPGYRMSSAYRLSENTARVLEIKITEESKYVREDQSARQ